MKLNEIGLPTGRPHRKRKRLGRGDGTGQGGTAGRGHKGQKARAGGFHKLGFEGGQMPLQRRIPKRGFTNIFRKEYAVVNLNQLDVFPAGSEVNVQVLVERGILSKAKDGLKVLARGELKHPLNITAAACSAQAKAKVEAAGGRLEVARG